MSKCQFPWASEVSEMSDAEKLKLAEDQIRELCAMINRLAQICDGEYLASEARALVRRSINNIAFDWKVI